MSPRFIHSTAFFREMTRKFTYMDSVSLVILPFPGSSRPQAFEDQGQEKTLELSTKLPVPLKSIDFLIPFYGIT